LLFVAPLCCTIVVVIVFFSHENNNNNSLFAFFYDAMCLARKKQKLEISKKQGKKGMFKVSKTHHTSTQKSNLLLIF